MARATSSTASGTTPRANAGASSGVEVGGDDKGAAKEIKEDDEKENLSGIVGGIYWGLKGASALLGGAGNVVGQLVDEVSKVAAETNTRRRERDLFQLFTEVEDRLNLPGLGFEAEASNSLRTTPKMGETTEFTSEEISLNLYRQVRSAGVLDVGDDPRFLAVPVEEDRARIFVEWLRQTDRRTEARDQRRRADFRTMLIEDLGYGRIVMLGSWSDAKSALVRSRPAYQNLADDEVRQEVFREVLVEAEDVVRAEQLAKEADAAYEVLLEESKLTTETTWAEIRPLIKYDVRFAAVKDDRRRVELFNRAIRVLKSIERERPLEEGMNMTSTTSDTNTTAPTIHATAATKKEEKENGEASALRAEARALKAEALALASRRREELVKVDAVRQALEMRELLAEEERLELLRRDHDKLRKQYELMSRKLMEMEGTIQAAAAAEANGGSALVDVSVGSSLEETSDEEDEVVRGGEIGPREIDR